MRLVFVTQVVDPDDPVLGATVAMVRALAERCDDVAVLTAYSLGDALPDNCRVRTFGSKHRVVRGLRFLSALAAELARRPRPAAVVAHMCPIYAVLAAPLARPLGVRVVLWYTQWRGNWKLRAAERLSTSLATAHAGAVPTASAKLAVIGHGIDVEAFAARRTGKAHDPFRLLALGRTSSAKGLPAIVRAIGLARADGLDVGLEVVGRAVAPAEREGLADLERVTTELDLSSAVVVSPAVPRSAVPGLLGSVDALVNNTAGGALDKVALEAAAAGLPVLASGPAFRELLEGIEPRLAFRPDDPDDLAAVITALAEASPETRRDVGAELRARVSRQHSVASWADGLIRLCAS